MASEAKSPRDLALNHPLSQAREPFDDPVGPFKPRGPQTGIIVRHGYLVAEWGEPKRVDMTFSVTKSFVSTVVGLAYDRGLIRDLDDKVAATTCRPSTSSRSTTARSPGTTCCGRRATGRARSGASPTGPIGPQGEPSTWTTRARNEPGSVYKYNDVRVNLLALAALHVWRRPLPQVLRELVMDPIGASNTWRWHGYDNSWVERGRGDGAVGQRRRPLGRRHVDQRPRPGALRPADAARRTLEGQAAPLGEVDRTRARRPRPPSRPTAS